MLREQLGLTGTKYGCGIAARGACAVHIDGVATRSCVRPVSTVEAGAKIVTIEGLSPTATHPLQKAWAGDAVPHEGRVKLDSAPLVENGNAVPVRVTVESPMTAASHVQEIAIFNERNPQRDVGRFQLSPANVRAEVSTRIRLATSQQLVALARCNDGSVWSHAVDVVVTLAACIEG